MRIEPRTFRALRILPSEERRTLAMAWLYLLVSDALVRFLPVPRVAGLLARLSVPSKRAVSAGRLACLVDIAARHHLHPVACLARSLALQALLRRHALEADLRIGVRRNNGRLQAHAWIEHAGHPVGEPGDIDCIYLPLTVAKGAS